MSTRVTVNGKTYDRDPGAAFMPKHVIIPSESARCEAEVHGRKCGRNVYFVVTGSSPTHEDIHGYWRHEPGTFWSSR